MNKNTSFYERTVNISTHALRVLTRRKPPTLRCLYRGRFDVWATRLHKSPTSGSNRFCVYGVGSKTLLTTARQLSHTRRTQNAPCGIRLFLDAARGRGLLCGYAGCASSTDASCCSSWPCVWLSSAVWFSASFSAASISPRTNSR